MWLSIIAITLVGTSDCYTTFRYAEISKSSIQRSVVPLYDVEHPYGTSNGWFTESYGYGGRDSTVNRNRYPNEGQGTRDDETEVTNAQTVKYADNNLRKPTAFNTVTERQSVLGAHRNVLNETYAPKHSFKNEYEINKTLGDTHKNATNVTDVKQISTDINIQYDDAKGKMTPTKHNERDQGSISMSHRNDSKLYSSIQKVNATVVNNGNDKTLTTNTFTQHSDNRNNTKLDDDSRKSNTTLGNSNAKRKGQNPTEIDKRIDDKLEGKTISDNEVTPKISDEQTGQEDRWVWGIAENVTQPTKPSTGLGDRAAFEGNACPTGRIKIMGKCVETD